MRNNQLHKQGRQPMKTKTKFYTVQFVADYFVMTVNVEAPNEETAETTANQLIIDYYGLDVLEIAHEVLAWATGEED